MKPERNRTGRITILEQEDEVLQFLDQLAAANEKSDNPWVLDRSDERYMSLLSGIVVFSISMDRVEGAFKMNQNKNEEDQRKVVDSLTASGCPFDQEVASSEEIVRSGKFVGIPSSEGNFAAQTHSNEHVKSRSSTLVLQK